MTILDEIIAVSSDSSVSISDLLHRLQIVAHRLDANQMLRWARAELTGYDENDDLPEYRMLSTNVIGTFAAPGGGFRDFALTTYMPDMAAWWSVDLRQPARTLQAYSDGDTQPEREWPAAVVADYRESGAYEVEPYTLFSARNIVPRESLHGVLDIIRTRAVDFALDLQRTDPNAGSEGGPTVRSAPELATVVYNVTNNIYGDGANVATGSGNRQRSRIVKGDTEALLREAQAIGLPLQESEEFLNALVEEKDLESPRLQRFLESVRSGAVRLAADVTTNTAANTLFELGKGFLGI